MYTKQRKNLECGQVKYSEGSEMFYTCALQLLFDSVYTFCFNSCYLLCFKRKPCLVVPVIVTILSLFCIRLVYYTSCFSLLYIDLTALPCGHVVGIWVCLKSSSVKFLSFVFINLNVSYVVSSEDNQRFLWSKHSLHCLADACIQCYTAYRYVSYTDVIQRNCRFI